MKLGNYTMVGTFSALIAGSVLLAPKWAAGQDQQGVEELTRGPVHEAFAASVSYNPEPGMIVKKAPPALIEEVPPDQRPEGDNVAWIPGYWGWDEEQGDFIWISGVWRNLPPGRQWMPGYWSDSDGQWQWTSGYWAEEETQEVAYLPPPPKSIESGPNVKAPSSNHVWISGNWIYRNDRYAWTPGYWEPAQANWIWIPAHYQWTHRGYVYIGGYWDYNVARRGMIFAPVRFHDNYAVRPGYCYTPLMVISLNVFMNHLFVRPSYGHYYFGDYYSPRYGDCGYHASHSYFSGHRGYDPIFVHSRWQHRDDRNWERSRINDFNYYRDNESARPAHTWAAMKALPEASRKGQRDNFQMAQPLASYVAHPDAGQRFQTVSKENRDKIVEQRQEMRKYGRERQQLETSAPKSVADANGKPNPITRHKLAKSPVVSKRVEQLSAVDAPPKRQLSPVAGRPDPNTSGTGNDRHKLSDIDGKSDPIKKPNTDKTLSKESIPRSNNEHAKKQPKSIAEPETDHKIAPDTKRDIEPTRRQKSEPTPTRTKDLPVNRPPPSEKLKPKTVNPSDIQPETRRKVIPENKVPTRTEIPKSIKPEPRNNPSVREQPARQSGESGSKKKDAESESTDEKKKKGR